MEYTYKLPKKLNLHNCNLTLYGGYTVNLKSKNKKLSVIADDIFSQELFRVRLNMHGGNNDEQNEYLDIYLYEQALIRTRKILNYELEKLENKLLFYKDRLPKHIYEKYVEGREKPEPTPYFKRKYFNKIDKFFDSLEDLKEDLELEKKSINNQIKNYNLLRKILKQNKNIMKGLYNIRNNYNSVLNMAKLNKDFELFEYNLLENYLSIATEEYFDKKKIKYKLVKSSFNYGIMDNDKIFEAIEEWKKSDKKYMLVYVSIDRIDSGHVNYLLLYKSGVKYNVIRIESNILSSIFNELYYLYKKDIKININKIDGINKLIKDFYDNIEKTEAKKGLIYKLNRKIYDIEKIDKIKELLGSKEIKDDKFKYLRKSLERLIKNLEIEYTICKTFTERDFNYHIIIPDNAIQTTYELQIKYANKLEEYLYDFRGFCSIFIYYITKEILKRLKSNMRLSLSKENIEKMINNIYIETREEIKNMNIEKNLYIMRMYDNFKELKDINKKKLEYEIQKALWISDISKELVKFRNTIIPFGVNDDKIRLIFVKRYFESQYFYIFF